MNANTRLWIDALRSGSYRQTSLRLRQPARFLRRRTAFCAIGVLYDLYLKSRGEKWPAKPPNGQLPQAVLDWAGITRELECEVVTHNDMGRSFRDIGSIIEAHFHRADRDRSNRADRDRRWEEAGLIASDLVDQARDSARRGTTAVS